MFSNETNLATEEHTPIAQRAEENLVYIREAIARSDSFTGISGWGMMAMGLIAIVGSWLAPQSRMLDGWLYSWAFVAVVACSVGVIAMCIKAYVRKTPLWAGSGRRFAMSFTPPILVGVVLSEVFYQNYLEHLLPCMWLMLYGLAVLNGGAYSVKPVPIAGAAFLLLGFWAGFMPLDVPTVVADYLVRDAVLAIGFGGIHLVLGAIVAARYGG